MRARRQLTNSLETAQVVTEVTRETLKSLTSAGLETAIGELDEASKIIVDGLGESLVILRVLLKLYQRFVPRDPRIDCHSVFTSTFLVSSARSAQIVANEFTETPKPDRNTGTRQIIELSDYDNVSLVSGVAKWPAFSKAMTACVAQLTASGWQNRAIERFQQLAEIYIERDFRLTLGNPRLKSRFEDLKNHLDANTNSIESNVVLEAHRDWIQWRWLEEPVTNDFGFALPQVCVPTNVVQISSDDDDFATVRGTQSLSAEETVLHLLEE
jgi:hypothetical protein